MTKGRLYDGLRAADHLRQGGHVTTAAALEHALVFHNGEECPVDEGEQCAATPDADSVMWMQEYEREAQKEHVPS